MATNHQWTGRSFLKILCSGYPSSLLTSMSLSKEHQDQCLFIHEKIGSDFSNQNSLGCFSEEFCSPVRSKSSFCTLIFLKVDFLQSMPKCLGPGRFFSGYFAKKEAWWFTLWMAFWWNPTHQTHRTQQPQLRPPEKSRRLCRTSAPRSISALAWWSHQRWSIRRSGSKVKVGTFKVDGHPPVLQVAWFKG